MHDQIKYKVAMLAIVLLVSPFKVGAEEVATNDRIVLLQQQLAVLTQLVALLQERLAEHERVLENTITPASQSVAELSVTESTAPTTLPPSALRFSNTQKWDYQLGFLNQRTQQNVAQYTPQLSVAPPPQTPDQISAEIEIIHELSEERTSAKVAEITRELQLGQTEVDGELYGTMIVERTNSYRMIVEALDTLLPLTIHYKKSFDRVRPSYYDSSVEAVIDVPGTPSYPSRYTTQIFLVAHILGELNPSLRDQYLEDAERVAKNRIIAGVSYPSDVEAGTQLAEDYYALLREKQWYQEAFAVAQTEW